MHKVAFPHKLWYQ